MRFVPFFASATAVCLGLGLAGCGGGSTSLTPQAGGAPTSAPTFRPSTAPSIAPSTAPSIAPSTAPSIAPSTAPSIAPSTPPSTPPGGITFNTPDVVISAIGSGCTTSAGFTASEAGYAGLFTAVSNNGAIASVAPAQSAGPFTVTATTTSNALGQATSITVSDTNGHSATETVTVAFCLP